MRHATRQVTEFIQRHSYPVIRTTYDPSVVEALDRIEQLMANAATITREERCQQPTDYAGLVITRMSLILEELHELVLALRDDDLHSKSSLREVNVADALADLAYVVIGTAVSLDIPLPEVFDEVHRSNMTKSVTGGVKPKGSSFEGPRIRQVIEQARQSMENR